jgi:hypothetical protein
MDVELGIKKHTSIVLMFDFTWRTKKTPSHCEGTKQAKWTKLPAFYWGRVALHVKQTEKLTRAPPTATHFRFLLGTPS